MINFCPASICLCVSVYPSVCHGSILGAYLSSYWPNLDHSTLTECLWTKSVELPWNKYLGQRLSFGGTCLGHIFSHIGSICYLTTYPDPISKVWTKHVRVMYFLPLVLSDFCFILIVPFWQIIYSNPKPSL